METKWGLKEQHTSDSNEFLESLVAMERLSLHLLMILLVLSNLMIPSTAVPSTRVQRLLEVSGALPALGDTHQDLTEVELEEVIIRRVDMEINDYPGSGPNNRHTPPGKS